MLFWAGIGPRISEVELFSWKTTSLKDHLEVCLPNSRLLSGRIAMWSSMKITLFILHATTSNNDLMGSYTLTFIPPIYKCYRI